MSCPRPPFKTKTKTRYLKTKTSKKWSWKALRPRPGLEANISGTMATTWPWQDQVHNCVLYTVHTAGNNGDICNNRNPHKRRSVPSIHCSIKVKCWWCYSWRDLHISCLLWVADLSCSIKMEVSAPQINCYMKLTAARPCRSSCGHSCTRPITPCPLLSCFVTRSTLSFHSGCVSSCI